MRGCGCLPCRLPCHRAHRACVHVLLWLALAQLGMLAEARELFQAVCRSPEFPDAKQRAVYWLARARVEEVRAAALMPTLALASAVSRHAGCG